MDSHALPDHALEEHAYRRAERDSRTFARQVAEAPLDPDVAAVLSWDEFPRSGVVLELGCGDGFVTRHLAARGLDVVGVDCSPTAIVRAERNLAEAGTRADFRVGDVCDLSGLASANFAAMLDSHCLHCVVSPAQRKRFLMECRRLLMPGGRLFVVTMAEQSMHWIEEGGGEGVRYARDTFGCWVESRRYEGTDREVQTRIFVTEERLRQELAEAGLQVHRFEEFAHAQDPADLAFLVSCGVEPSSRTESECVPPV